MTNFIAPRATALFFAAVATLAVFTGIDGLAAREQGVSAPVQQVVVIGQRAPA